MALDIERIEWWIIEKSNEMKMKANREKLKELEENDKTFCREVKDKGKFVDGSFKFQLMPQLTGTVTSEVEWTELANGEKVWSYKVEEVKLKNQNNEQNNKTNHKD